MCTQVGARGGAKCEAEGREASVLVRMEVTPVTRNHDAKDHLARPEKTIEMFCLLDRQVPEALGELHWPVESWLECAAWPQGLCPTGRRIQDQDWN